MARDDSKRFLCNCEWNNILRKLPDESRLRVYDAIFDYAATGENEELELLEQIAFEPIRCEIERYVKHYEKKCEKLRANVQKRWNNTNEETEIQKNTKEYKCKNGNTNVGNPNPNPNPKVPNGTIKETTLTCCKEKTADKQPHQLSNGKELFEYRKATLIQDESEYGEFNTFLLQNCNTIVSNFESLPTAKQVERMYKEYGKTVVQDTIQILENSKKYNKSYKDLYITLMRSWLPRERESIQRMALTYQKAEQHGLTT